MRKVSTLLLKKLTHLCCVFSRYTREKRDHQLKECERRIAEHESSIKELATDIESVRDTIAVIDKEVNESNASMTNLRENIRVRKITKEIDITQAEIDAMDMERAAKARRQFDQKYALEKQREMGMQSKVGLIQPQTLVPRFEQIRPLVFSHRRRAKLAQTPDGNARK